MIAATPTLVPALAPVERGLATVRRRRGAEATRGLAPGLLVPEGGPGWFPATNLVKDSEASGESDLGRLLTAASQRWAASPHAAGALAWRSYTYWLALPVVLGWTLARRVLLVDPADVLVRLEGDAQLLTLGWRRARLVVLPDDPLAGAGAAPLAAEQVSDLTVVDSEPELLAALRQTLRDEHLDPVMTQLRHRVRLGSRALLGSLASAVSYAVLRGLEGPSGSRIETAQGLLSALDVENLVELEPGPAGPVVHRRTCCLAFTLPEPKICASCCLRR